MAELVPQLSLPFQHSFVGLVLPVVFIGGTASIPFASLATQAPAPRSRERTPPPPASSNKDAVTTPTRTPAGAGLPAPLIALLRSEGPWSANEVYSVTPTEPLTPVEEEVPAPEWYAITHGRFVGVVDQFALSAVAITGVGNAARKAYTTQALALTAFNKALTWGGVQVA
ncbi:hypothetical protein B0H15DRAFT_950398 [Mycena belliarum]|uniref:Uncharacterized protein n=1 Tax=Mycena belliarum TaxID=1033014 RepID=A0AAD6U213_9AGAR|nr:hypothetical protein B0H15DRAFT_950398 [Mycena belliae]